MRGIVLSLVGLWAAACGGGGESAPGPLRFTLDDMHIAGVPLEEKQAVIAAKQEWDVAQMERAKAESDYQDSQTKLDVAKNEAEQAELAEKSAQTEKNAADKSADLNRKNNAERELRNAQLGRRAADSKISWLKAHRGYLKKLVRFSQRNAYAKQARYELEKARVAQAKNIRPAGFDLGNFERQYKERSEQAQRAKHEADQEKQKADGKKKEYEGRLAEYNDARGLKTPPGMESK
jgi:hypothetical protein